eukprot:gb/GFBE01030920.1/.p1 GENE.gb/GFBE01030920.1/~~gb/GFBE01030920.1/.p1  ORF type:complete len:432 (+),score=92.51 gb/GFBE01030920.1/:1-1296(+)
MSQWLSSMPSAAPAFALAPRAVASARAAPAPVAAPRVQADVAPETRGGAGAVSAVVAGCGVAVVAGRRGRRQRRHGGQVHCRAVATETETERPVYPFSAIVGQAEMKLSLILNVIDPKIGGCMILGDRGTGKTTTIRAVTDLLPQIECVQDDLYNSSPSDQDLMSKEVRMKVAMGEKLETYFKTVPMVDLPLGATEDRVCGTIDIEKALTEGVKAFEPGLLARANRGILYVDEVNLLDDHLVDVLLDSAASGRNTVEREGISMSHPARFILIGSGNPEEGELRPQLMDRFGMHALIRTERDPDLRVRIVQWTREFAEDPAGFRARFAEDNKVFAKQIVEATARLQDVSVDPVISRQISEICFNCGVEGIRGDLVVKRAARAYCSFDGRTEVTVEDVKKVVTLCLRHRLPSDVMDSTNPDDRIAEVVEEVFG